MSVKEQAKPDEGITFHSEQEMPPLAVSVAASLANKTGSWRYLRPIYDPRRPPCSQACPAGNDIQGFIALITKERFYEAWELLRRTNPFPAICGRVCHHPCELDCNRRQFDEPISIRLLERLAADEGYKEDLGSPRPTSGMERVAIVGSGPAGLSCAYFLALRGYGVTVFEAEREPGGMLRLGIPDYRLPREVLDREIELVKRLGVEIETGVRVGEDLPLEELAEFGATFIAVGATKSRPLKVPGIEARGVLHGLDFLKRMNRGERVELGQTVAIIGGGNTAMDAARCALRLGAKPSVIYRRTRAEMPAIPEEIEAAEEEGVDFQFLASPVEVLTSKGKIEGAKFIKMELGEPDESGRRRPVPIPGSEFELELDNLILAIGEEPDLSFLPASVQLKAEGLINDPVLVESGLEIFAGGDAATGAGTVVDAIASGRQAAEAIDRRLRGLPEPQPQEPAIVPFERINLDYFEHQARVTGAVLQVAERVANLEEVERGLSGEQGPLEAERCFSCGVCNQCDNCLVYCPDVAIFRQGEEYSVDYDYCKGCGICAQECPRWVISLIEEEE